jgi:ABC-type Fe3+-hydroxamate transport system substrate-binding protein
MDTIVQCPWETPIETEYWGYEGTAEAVLDLNPDVIILNNWTDDDYETVVEQLNDNPLWAELDAVQNERVLSTPGYDNPIASSLPALQKFLDVYMPLLFPDVLDGPLTEEVVQEILAQ